MYIQQVGVLPTVYIRLAASSCFSHYIHRDPRLYTYIYVSIYTHMYIFLIYAPPGQTDIHQHLLVSFFLFIFIRV